jgi:hypothetical protein
MTEYFPAQSPMKAQNGSDGVMNFIESAAGNGSIGFDEYSYALLANFPVAQVLNTAGYYTLPNQYNVAVALQLAVINQDPTSQDYLTQKLDAVYTNPDPRAYPLSSYSYAIIPTGANNVETRAGTTAKRQTLTDFLYYSICPGQAEIGAIGYSSLPVNLVKAGFSQIAKLKKADPAVDLTQRDVTTCNNPTFDKSNPSKNLLAELAPPPKACDKSGQGPCGATQAAAPAVTAGGGAPTGGAGATGGATAGATSGPTAAAGGTGGAGAVQVANPAGNHGSAAGRGGPSAPAASASVDPQTGLVETGGGGDLGGGSNAVNTNVQGADTELAASSTDQGMNIVLWSLTVVFLIAALVLPVGFARFFGRR